MNVIEDTQEDIGIDYRIARCRHERLRQALQFQVPARQVAQPVSVSRTKVEVKAPSKAASRIASPLIELNPVERFFVGVIKASLSLLALILAPLTC